MKQPTKFVLYAVVEKGSGMVVAVALTRQAARAIMAEVDPPRPLMVRRAKGVLFDT